MFPAWEMPRSRSRDSYQEKGKEKYRTKLEFCKVLCVRLGYKRIGSQVENLIPKSSSPLSHCSMAFAEGLFFQAAAPLSPIQLLSEFWPFFSSIRELDDSTGSYALITSGTTPRDQEVTLNYRTQSPGERLTFQTL